METIELLEVETTDNFNDVMTKNLSYGELAQMLGLVCASLAVLIDEILCFTVIFFIKSGPPQCYGDYRKG